MRIRRFSCLPVLAALALLAGCGTMQSPEALVLGEPKPFKPIEIGPAPAGMPSERALIPLAAAALRMKEQGTEPGILGLPQIRAMLHVPRAARQPGGAARLRGACVVVPGILGEFSAGHVVDALQDDGWCVAVVWPPVVPRIREEMRDSGDASASERGVKAAQAVDELLRRTATVAQLLLVELHGTVDGLEGKPVILVCESMGAIVGVGLAATGEIPFDAALFVAGGGGFIDVARGSALRSVLFGGIPLEDPAFAEAFRASCELDPLRCAESLRGGPIAVITADRDEIVPIATQEALWSALGEPARFRWDAGHLELFSRGSDTIVPVVRRIADVVGDSSRAATAIWRRVDGR